VGKSSYNPISVENKLMLRYPQLSWVSVNTWGSTTEIVLQEGDAAPELEDSDAVGNIVATRSGQILQMEIDHGKATVQVGDGVAPGQLLVSGVLEEEDGGVSFTKATAKIMARTHRTYSVSIPMEESVAVDTGETAQRVTLHLFNVPIPLSFCFTPDGNYRTETSSNPVTIFGVTLPITIDRETYTFQGVETVAISEEEARKRGEALLLEEVEKALENSEENGTVLSKTVSVRAETGEYIIECEFVCVENIAQEQEFFVDLKKDFPEKNDDFSEDA
jgi:similar to stage IV sporulation protein